MLVSRPRWSGVGDRGLYYLTMAERDLARLLAGLAPVARPVPYVVVETDADVPAAAIIVEDEATTKAVEQSVADSHGLAYEFVAAWITCTIESDLEAVGMTAAISAALTEVGIPCNVLAGSRHDHLLVPWDRRIEALDVLTYLNGPHPTDSSCSGELVTRVSSDPSGRIR